MLTHEVLLIQTPGMICAYEQLTNTFNYASACLAVPAVKRVLRPTTAGSTAE